MIKHEDLIFDNKLSYFKNEKRQTRVSLLLEFFSDAYLTENRTEYRVQSSTQVTIPLDHRTRTKDRLKAAISISRICSSRRPHDRE